MFSFQDTCHLSNGASYQIIKTWGLTVTIDFRSGLRTFQARRQCFSRNSFQHASTSWHRPLSQLLVLPRDVRYFRKGLRKRALLQVSRQENPSVFDPDRGSHIISPLRTVHLIGYVAFNRLSSVVLKPQLVLLQAASAEHR